MEQRTIQMLFALLRSAISGSKLTEEERNDFSDELIPGLIKVASKHDIAHLLVSGLKLNGLVSKGDMGVERSLLKAIYRCEHLKHEYENLCSTLERAQIPFLPLKGSIIRDYYPEAWMRTSCDIDVLVREEDLERAMAVLVEGHGYTYQKEGSHEIVFFSQNNVVIELHHDLIEEGRVNASSDVLKHVWDVVTLREGFAYWYEMPNELFYFYHIAHMAKHFMSGGCGIKPFMDLWVLEGKMTLDTQAFGQLLQKGQLMDFYSVVKQTVSVWFGDAAHNNVTANVEKFVLDGGTYGTVSNASVIAAATGESRLATFLKWVFISRENLEKLYPELEQRPNRFVYYQVKRWFRIFNKSKREKIKNLAAARNSVTDGDIKSASELLNRLGLDGE